MNDHPVENNAICLPGCRRRLLLLLVILAILLPAIRAEARPAGGAVPIINGQPDTVAPALPENPILADYVRYAQFNSPAVKRAFHTWRAELEKIGYVGTLPDPMVMFGYMVEHVETRVGPQSHRLNAQQTIPWIGKLRAEKAMASAEADAAFRRLQATQLATVYSVTQAYYDFWLLGREISLTEENMELLSFWEEIARTRYSSALASHPDIIKVQVELGKLENELLSLRDRLTPAREKLRAELNLSDTVMLPVPEDTEPPTVTLDETSLLIAVDSTNPNILAMERMIARESANVRSAKSAWYPNVTVGFDYFFTGEAMDPSIPGSGDDPWMVSAGINLPIWVGKNNARVAEARARERAARYELADSRNRLRAYASEVTYRYRDADRRFRLYRDGLVPKAEQALNTAYTAYQSGETDFLTVLDAQRQLLAFQLEQDRALAQTVTRLAELERLTGQPLGTLTTNKNKTIDERN